MFLQLLSAADEKTPPHVLCGGRCLFLSECAGWMIFKSSKTKRTGYFVSGRSLRSSELLPGQHLISLQVFADRLFYDILRQRPVIARVGLEPVAGELLVEGRLAVPRLVLVSWPETGAVGCEHLIAEDEIAVLIQAELEFGIRNDDAAASRVIRTFLVKRDGIIAELGRVFFAFAREIFSRWAMLCS